MGDVNPHINLKIRNNSNANIRLANAQLVFGKFTNGDPTTNLPVRNINGRVIANNGVYYSVYAYGLQGQDGSVEGSIDVNDNNNLRICTISWNNPFAIGNNAVAIDNLDPNYNVPVPGFPAEGPLGDVRVTIV